MDGEPRNPVKVQLLLVHPGLNQNLGDKKSRFTFLYLQNGKNTSTLENEQQTTSTLQNEQTKKTTQPCKMNNKKASTPQNEPKKTSTAWISRAVPRRSPELGTWPDLRARRAIRPIRRRGSTFDHRLRWTFGKTWNKTLPLFLVFLFLIVLCFFFK